MHRIESSILVSAPVSECYRHWMQFERFPEYMRRIVKVTRLKADIYSQGTAGLRSQANKQQNADIWYCEVRGPFGRVYSLNATLVYCEPEKCIGWATAEVGGCFDIASTGTVNFLRPASERAEQTLIDVTMSYSPSGLLGDLLTDVTAYGDNVVSDCLEDFKQHVETEYQLELGRQIQTGATAL